MRIGIIPRCDRNNDIYEDTKTALQIIRFPVPKEVPYHENREHKQDDHENLKVQIHVLAEAPANYNGQRSVQQSSLNRRTQTVEECKVDLVIPTKVSKEEVL